MDNIHIFDNITSAELDKMMVCFKSEIKSFPAHKQLLSSSTGTNQIGVLLSGEADLVKYDFDGYRSILEHLSKQDISAIFSFSPSVKHRWKLCPARPAGFSF